MEITFSNVTKDNRKELLKAVGEIIGLAPVYMGAPGFAFSVGNFTIDRNGALIPSEYADMEGIRTLLTELAERGFVSAYGIDGIVSNNPADSEDVNPSEHSVAYGGSGNLVINMPLSGFTASAIDNLEKLVAAKSWIIQKMSGADALPIERDEKYLAFPWFGRDSSPEEVDAYSLLVARLCESAKEKQRVVATERRLEDGDNEKFKARCFLLSLGFIGKEYAQARKILLAPMSGNGSHKVGNGKKLAPTADTAADSGGESPVGVAVFDGTESAQNAVNAATLLKCSACDHHRYYADSQLCNSTGDAVDTSSRAPDSYTHYCLNSPSGYRKLKHGAEWSGFETAPKWCPLNGGNNCS